MPILDITYNPYKRKTQVLIDNVDVQTNDEHLTIKEFINNRVPLQTWIESIKAKGWDGIVSHLIRKDDAGEIVIRFTGRKLDFEDLKCSLEEQAASRAKDCPVELVFDKNNIRFSLDDHIMMENIEYVKEKMLSDEFKAIMRDVKDEKSIEAYENLERNFVQAFDSEFRIVLAGTYSCGKSSIINALIGKTVLPMFVETTTTRKCKVIHETANGEKIRLVAIDSKESKLVDETFDSDLDCRNRFEQISPAGQKETTPKGVDEIHIYMDLSHLYPEENRDELSKKFRIVLIDTPGVDSGKSATTNEDNEIVNPDKEVALSAINGQDREIVIVCSDAEHYQGTALGDLLYHIHRASKDDNGFNDRFFFVMNKSDEIFAAGLGKHKGLFADSLSDSSKWGVRDSYLTPRIFMVSAKTKLLVQNGVHNLSENDNTVRRNLTLRNEVSFINRIYADGRDFEEARLFDVCDLPLHKREEIDSCFEDVINSDNRDEALNLLSGIKCIEIAIQDYISRYAYPLKIQKLLDTFEILLDVVKKSSEKQEEILGKKNIELGKKQSEGEGVERDRAEKERRKEEREKLKKRIEVQKDKITNYQPAKTTQIKDEFYRIWFGTAIVEDTLRAENDSTMSSSEYEIVKSKLTNLFKELNDEALKGYDQMRNQEQDKMNAIAKDINCIYEEFKGTPLEDLLEMSFGAKSIGDPQKILSDVLRSTEENKTECAPKLSPVERVVRFFKRVISFGKWGKTEKIIRYPWNEIKKVVIDFEADFATKCDELDTEFKEKRTMIIERANFTLDSVVEGVESAERTLAEYNEKLEALQKEGQGLDAEIARVTYNITFLTDLSKRISQTC